MGFKSIALICHIRRLMKVLGVQNIYVLKVVLIVVIQLMMLYLLV
jgi:hypothetical protein